MEEVMKETNDHKEHSLQAVSDSSGQTDEAFVENKQNVAKEQFKKPQLFIGPQRGKISKKLNKSVIELEDNDSTKTTTVPENYDRPTEKNTNFNKIDSSQLPEKLANDTQEQKSSHSKPAPPLPYVEPDWSGLPPHEYKLEELKSGIIVKTIDLTERSFSVFGRLETCDIAMLHPTVSRYHAVLQYRATGDEPGYYIYDLGSSLGTFLNKQKLKSKTYVRVKVGHVLKIGCSTRMFILQGPSDDEEPESELTVTEMKKQYQEKLAALEEEKTRLEAEREERLKRDEERGIDWGMGEDADEETDLTENPYASTQNEELYLDDPKKTLRGWFEREGEELVYDVEEKGFGHFICRIELPVDNGGGGNLVAEASVKGKKKEAVVQAALEACRLLDRQGLLRQATQESKKRASKDWEAMDFYDSDEDNFLDRTGQIEKKRQQRMAQSGKLEQPVETYDSLVEKYQAVVKELEQTECKLDSMLSLATQADRRPDAEDDLDAYMSRLSHLPADKIQVRKMKDEVAKLRAEEGRLRNLVNIARPAELPKLEPVPKQPKEKRLELPQGLIGKKVLKKRAQPQESTLPQQTTQQQVMDSLEEFDDEDERAEEEEVHDRSTGQNQPKGDESTKKKRSRTDTRNRAPKRKFTALQVDDEDYSNCTWTPPQGQTGDGRTSLNDKFGY